MPSKEGDRVRYSAAERMIALVSIPMLVGLLFVLDWLFGTNSVTKAVGALVFALVICCFVIAVFGSHSED
jgi:O-antigen/teichoic acid export membrane protein